MKKKLDKLFKELSCCQKCTSLRRKNGKDCSLINFYQDKKMYSKIPSIWTDWSRRENSNIMIIGQDWGPFRDMEKLYQAYKVEETSENWCALIESEKSLTKKMLTKYLEESASKEQYPLEKNFLDSLYITNAIMCARKGTEYRGDLIDLKTSTQNCSEYLKKQIELIKPKIIVTLGYYPLYSMSINYSFSIEKTLVETIQKNPEINMEEFTIIPLYHPTAQIIKEKQLEQYQRIWRKMKEGNYELKK